MTSTSTNPQGQIVTSSIFSVNWKDVVKGLIIAILTPVLLIVQQSVDAGSLVFNWKAIGMAAVAGGVAYLLKNFFTPSTVITPNDASK